MLKTSNKQSLKICSYNIHKGFNLGNTQYLLSKIRESIRLVNADIVFLQEVVGENQKKAHSVADWAPETQFEFLADSVWHHHAYGKNSIYGHGHHGNSILSRFPIEASKNVDVSTIPLSRRGVLHARILDNLHLFCVHFGLFKRERRSQLKRMIEIVRSIAGEDEPLIIAGDFNDWRNQLGAELNQELHVEEAISTYSGRAIATFPAKYPLFPMDRIYFRGVDLVNSRVLKGEPWTQLSDHCAVFAEFLCDQNNALLPTKIDKFNNAP